MNFTPVRSIPSTLNNIAGRLRTARPPNKKQRRHENRQRASKRSHIAPPIAVRTRFVHVWYTFLQRRKFLQTTYRTATSARKTRKSKNSSVHVSNFLEDHRMSRLEPIRWR